jgi:hypothetical protein
LKTSSQNEINSYQTEHLLLNINIQVITLCVLSWTNNDIDFLFNHPYLGWPCNYNFPSYFLNRPNSTYFWDWSLHTHTIIVSVNYVNKKKDRYIILLSHHLYCLGIGVMFSQIIIETEICRFQSTAKLRKKNTTLKSSLCITNENCEARTMAWMGCQWTTRKKWTWENQRKQPISVIFPRIDPCYHEEEAVWQQTNVPCQVYPFLRAAPCKKIVSIIT